MNSFLLILIILFSSFEIYSRPRKSKAKEISTTTEIKTITNKKFHYRYSLNNKNNPFLPPVIASLTKKIEIQVVSELQKYPLSQLKLSGTWLLKGKERTCLIVTPSNRNLTANIGDPIGRKGGKISKIEEDYIQVVYTKLLKTGVEETKEEFLYIRKPKEEKTQTRERIIIRPENAKKETLPNQPSGRIAL